MISPWSLVVLSRQFWAGVAASVIAVLLIADGVPNLFRSRIAARGAGSYYQMRSDRDSIGGGGGGDIQGLTYLSMAGSPGYDERKMIRNASIDLIVKHPKGASDSIRKLAEDAGGFLISAEASGGENAPSASLTVRVPVNKLEDVRAKIVRLGVRVQSEKVEARDVTKQYVDLSAQLRNLRAQETQYLGILKQARTVKDTVEVSEKLNEVRSQIDQQQAEFDTLSKQVETVALTVSLRAEADVQVFGLQWRPLYRLKEAARNGMDSIGDYASAMASFVFFIPALILWICHNSPRGRGYMAVYPVELEEAVCQTGNRGVDRRFSRRGRGAHVRLLRAVETLWNPHPEYMNLPKPTEWSDSTKVVRFCI